jgi:hypothetical protein
MVFGTQFESLADYCGGGGGTRTHDSADMSRML